MKTKITFLLSLTFLFLFSGSVYGDDFQDGVDAADRGDFKTAYKSFLPLAEQGDAKAQYNLGVMYGKGLGVPQDYALAHMWFQWAQWLCEKQRHSRKENVSNSNRKSTRYGKKLETNQEVVQ